MPIEPTPPDKVGTVVIAGGKRYKVVKRGKKWIEEAESMDFNFIEIGREDILRIADEGRTNEQTEAKEE